MCATARFRFLLSIIPHVSLLYFLVPTAEAGRRVESCNTCYQAVVTYPTILRAGSEPEDLQVHIVGQTYDTIELFFREEFHRESLPHTNLHCGRVVLAPKNELGTFAVLLGPCSDTLVVYGWKKGEFVPTRAEFLPMAGSPLNIRWVTPRILKATNDDGKELIIRFNDSDEGWSTLHSDVP